MPRLDPGLPRTEGALGLRRVLPVAYWVTGAVNAVVALYGFVYLSMAFMFATVPWSDTTAGGTDEVSPAVVVGVFAALGLAFICGFGAVSCMQIRAGTWLSRGERLPLVRTVAYLTLVFIPFGTALGVLTLVALRDLELAPSTQPEARP